MNILILTPERVGSTLIERVICTYMSKIDYDKPVINIHRLIFGIEKYYSDLYKQEILRSTKRKGYHQSLPEKLEMIRSIDHYTVFKIPFEYMIERNDSICDQTDFYRYLNNNFYVIGCRRDSVFERALSRGIRTIRHEKITAFSHDQKIADFSEMYKNKITIPKESFIKYLNEYKDYIKWADTYFDVRSFFNYEKHAPSIEEYVRSLDCFSNKNIKDWKSMFGLSWDDWNKCRYLFTGVGACAELLQKKSDSNTALTVSDVAKNLPSVAQEFLKLNAVKYMKSLQVVDELIDKKILVQGIPIKLQTLVEKRMIIKNFNECAITYNEWANQNNFPIIASSKSLIDQAYNELKYWYKEVPDSIYRLE